MRDRAQKVLIVFSNEKEEFLSFRKEENSEWEDLHLMCCIEHDGSWAKSFEMYEYGVRYSYLPDRHASQE